MTEWMGQAVNDVYRQWLDLPPDWTAQQRDRYLSEVTARLDRMAAQMADDLAASSIQEWAARHGQHPDYQMTVKLRQTALQNAREMVVRQELYDQIEEPPEQTVDFDPPLHQPLPASQVPWNLRWNDVRYRTEPGERIEALTEMVWPAPQFSVMFRIKAAYLLSVLLEDQLPVPDGPQHPLASDLAPLVYEDLRVDGYPVE